MDLNIHSPLPLRRDFRIGLLGSGFMVNECHLVAYRKAGFNPIAIASRDAENAARVAARHGIPKVHHTVEQLLDDPAVEILDIAVPPDAQLGLIKAACQRRTVRGILAQTPLGVDFHEAVEAVRACEDAGITLAVNQSMRYDQSVRAAKTLLQNGTLGEPVLATIDLRGIPHWKPRPTELRWLTLRTLSIHHLDSFRYWFGDPANIYCSVRADPRKQAHLADAICVSVLEYAGGLRCVAIDDPWTGPAREGCPSDTHLEWRIEGVNGLALGDIGCCKEPVTTPSTLCYAAKGDPVFCTPKWAESWFPDAFIGTMAQLLLALERDLAPALSGRDHLKTMALVEAACLSATERRAVSLEEIEQRIGLPDPLMPSSQTAFISRLFASQRSLDEQTTRNLTPLAQQVLVLARREAERLNHHFIGTEHLLLGLVELGQGAALKVLRKLGVTLERVRQEVERQVAAGPVQAVFAGRFPYTPRVKRVLNLASQEAEIHHQGCVGTEHLLLGLLREEGIAARVLTSLGADLDQIRQEILRELQPAPSA